MELSLAALWPVVRRGPEGLEGNRRWQVPTANGLLPQARFTWVNLRSGRGGTVPENHLNSHHLYQVHRRDSKQQVG